MDKRLVFVLCSILIFVGCASTQLPVSKNLWCVAHTKSTPVRLGLEPCNSTTSAVSVASKSFAELERKEAKKAHASYKRWPAPQNLRHSREPVPVKSAPVASLFAELEREEAKESRALVVAQTDGERAFVQDAATFLNSQNITSITMDELNELLGIERAKDLLGCDDVKCFSEIGGALNVQYVLLIKTDETPGKAVLILYDQHDSFKQIAHKIVSHESAVDVLVKSIEEFRNNRKATVKVLKNVPCGFPIKQLELALGKSDKHVSDAYYYFDIKIIVTTGGKTVNGSIVGIRELWGKGSYILKCY